MPPIEEEAVADLVQRYAEAACAHGRATEAGDHATTNQASEVIAGVYRELRRRGVDAQSALLPLLHAAEPGVRLWAGSHALEFAPADGERALSALEDGPERLLAFSAKMTLRQWRSGCLVFR